MKLFFITFFSIFIAELGDKTQLATMGFAASNTSAKWTVFIASAIALTLSSFLGVFFGQYIATYFSPRQIQTASAILFILIGFFMLHSVLKGRVTKKYTRIITYLEEKQNTECISCEKLQTQLKKANSKPIPDRFITTDTHPEKGCDNCSAEELKKLLEE